MEIHPHRRFGLMLAAWLVSGTVLYGWSDQGHRIVALAAQENLSENSKRRIAYLMGKGVTLADVSTWANEIVAERPDTEAWHSITVPPGAEHVDLRRDCPLGDCITVQIRNCIGIVRLSIRPRSEIVDAFKMLVSLAADMHQPLLNGYPPAHGKEDRIVLLDGVEMSLFDAWDGGLVARLGSEDEVLARVRRRIASADTAAWTQGTYKAWTWETHRIAAERVYPSIDDPAGKTTLQGVALEEASDVVVELLAKSAVRLTHMLEVAWP